MGLDLWRVLCVLTLLPPPSLPPSLPHHNTEVNEGHEGKRKNESLWPVHQINWQRSRYIFDMFYRYKEISREVYDYCVQMVRCGGGKAWGLEGVCGHI